jgi:glycosyltransferase involved in cell wall biosynthesis
VTRDPVRILRVFSRLNIGGPSFHVVLLTEGLTNLGYETRLVVGREGEREGNLLDFAARKRVACIQLDGLGREIRPLADLRSFWALVTLIREFRPAIVHTHTAKAGLLGRAAACVAGVPVIVHTYHGHVLRGYFGHVKTAAFKGIESLLNRGSHAVIAVSDAVRDDLVSLGVTTRAAVRVIPLGLDLDFLARAPLPRGGLRREAGVPDDAPLVGVVGRLVPIKDIPTFLRAAQRVLATKADCRFAIVGDGEDRAALESEALRLGLDGRVFFHGWRRDMDNVYGDLDLVVNCSLNEGTPVALIEALAAGRPVVATRVGGNPDLLGDGARGRLVAAGDSEALAAAILEALAQAMPASQQHAARDYVLERHSVGRLVSDIDRLYQELLAAHPRTA